MKVLFTQKLPGGVEKLLRDEGYHVIINPENKPAPKSFIIKNGRDADAVISLLNDVIDAEIIDSFLKCRIIANVAVGYNNIDIEAAKKKNIIVTNTPGILTDATADLAAALALACARRIVEGDNLVRKGRFKGWKMDMLLGIELRNKIAGIIGAGRIGQETAKRLKAFGMKIIYFNRSKKEIFEKETGAKKVSLDRLMKISDLISIHLPLTGDTKNLISKEKLSLMKPSAILINTARGEIIDEKHLVKMLARKKLFAAGFDVYQNEPSLNNGLLQLVNTVLLPHIGSATFETRKGMALLAVENVIRVLKGKKPITPVFN